MTYDDTSNFCQQEDEQVKIWASELFVLREAKRIMDELEKFLSFIHLHAYEKDGSYSIVTGHTFGVNCTLYVSDKNGEAIPFGENPQYYYYGKTWIEALTNLLKASRTTVDNELKQEKNDNR